MTEATTLAPPADSEAERKAKLMAECERLGIKVDKRYSEKRMEDLIAEKANGQAPAPKPKAPEPVKSVETSAEREIAVDETAQRMAKLEAELAEAREALAAKAAEPAPQPQPYNAPKGMLTSAQLIGTGALAKEEEEKRLLMEQCSRLGIATQISPRANNDAIRDHINRHMAAKKVMQDVLDEQDRRAAKAPPKTLVKMRVLPLGDGKISKGIHIPGMGDAMYSRGDIVDDVELATAQAHEKAGMGEIVGG